MPQHKSAMKRVKQNLKKKISNSIVINQLRGSIKDLEKSVIEKDQKRVKLCIERVNSLAFKAVKKGIIKKNAASRRVSKLSKLLKH